MSTGVPTCQISSHLNHNVFERRLQKRIDDPEGKLRKAQGERARGLRRLGSQAPAKTTEQENTGEKTKGTVTTRYVASADATRILKEHEQAEYEKRKQR